MNNQEINYMLRSGCKKYYRYLNEMEKSFPTKYGKSVIAVLQIQCSKTPTAFELVLSQKLVNPDMCYVFVDHRKCDHISIKKYNSGKRTLLIEVDESFLEEFEAITIKRLEIVSDMKFLIEMLGKFYDMNKLKLKPDKPKTIPDIPQKFIDPMSAEQRNAYYGVFASPVSYVWGAPGTGKTKMVLSRCILRYVLHSKRIFLLAPTNNAIEQVLRGVLPVMKDADIPLDNVYRLGTSSEEFTKEYPEVVGDKDLELAIAELKAETESVRQNISHCLELENAYIKDKEFNDFLHSTQEAVSSLLSSHTVLTTKISQAQAEQLQKVSNLKKIDQKKCKLEDTHSRQTLRHSECQRLIDSNISTLNRWRKLFWKRRNCEQLNAENAKLYLVLLSLKEELSKTEKELSPVHHSYAAALVELKAVEKELETLRDESAEIEHTLSKIFSSNSNIQNLAPALPITNEKAKICIETFNKMVAESDQQIANTYSPSIQNDIMDLRLRLTQLEKEMQSLHQNKKMQQKRRAWVLAGTIESSLPHLRVPNDEPPIAHVFIDEAGYTSLARGLSAFICDCPVTFLGDHLQLPPICEMERIHPDSAEVSLFSLSVAHYPAILDNSMSDVYTNFYKLEKNPINTDTMPMLPLTYTYRFGEDLAKLLSEYFYPIDFHGNSKSPFEVIILDAPHKIGKDKRTNQSELNAIRSYLSNTTETDYAILTPYRNQQALLRNTGFDKDKVLTVHRSQGREWDTVIFSVVDSYDKFYVDSRTPKGRQVLNTAISRARKRLVIACDVSYWSTQREQFIYSLLKLSNST